jgi:3',5'-nucleoside bisphosphate phosphatase
MIDLHAHSTFSDGSLTPAQLAEAGRRAGLHALALTDHDTVDGVVPFLQACRRDAGLIGVPGLEISADFAPGTLHVLGYFTDAHNEKLRATLQRSRDSRELRNAEILERLARLGMPLTAAEVAAFAGEQVAGRPHIAQAMLKKGYVGTFREAFDRYLGKGREGYADRFRLEPRAAVALIRDAGGVPVLAHPFTLRLGRAKLTSLVASFKEAGLEGVEVIYPEHDSRRKARYARLARELDLVVTGGTDFHGAINPHIALGRGGGRMRVPDETLDALTERRDRIRAALASRRSEP